MILLIISLLSTLQAADLDFTVKRSFNRRELDLDYVRRIDVQMRIVTDFPSFDGSGVLDMERLGLLVRVFLSPTGSTGAALEAVPRLHYEGEDICSLEVTDAYFRFQSFQSRLPNSWDRAILRSLQKIDSLDPQIKKPLFLNALNDKLRDTIAEYCFGPLF